jgi:Na+/H+ antiporter NhaD/arsenite permease-like protein
MVCESVAIGALTYIGNAPNFMVYAIATERGIRMPSFFGCILWAAVVLLPSLHYSRFFQQHLF